MKNQVNQITLAMNKKGQMCVAFTGDTWYKKYQSDANTEGGLLPRGCTVIENTDGTLTALKFRWLWIKYESLTPYTLVSLNDILTAAKKYEMDRDIVRALYEQFLVDVYYLLPDKKMEFVEYWGINVNSFKRSNAKVTDAYAELRRQELSKSDAE